ncbi:hypothetical protein L6164_030574 [Bauhinia variegata]|uniref:Uncharacterized protein n=1 Tax=Bauhinia variegata TaxID=167791 RepID=A0ACB9LC49_BAUVA|nr:hypothetical protein L6164_030574 [Bauhinia variegata]
MAEKQKNKVENEVGCGFMGIIFQLRNHRLRKSSVHSLPMKPTNIVGNDLRKDESKKPLTPSYESRNSEQKAPRKSTSGSGHPTPPAHRNNQNRRPSNAARSSTSSSGNSTHLKTQQSQEMNDDSNLRRESTGNTLELARTSTGQQRDKENRAQVKVTGNLLVHNSPRTNTKILESPPRNKDPTCYNNVSMGVMGNIVRKNSDEFRSPRNRMDPEALKCLGNELYKQGRFKEALCFYDRAITLDSNKATYHCNKSAALIGLGRLLEAIVECEEAIRLEPSYNRAHHRLATLYIRLGEAEKALNHCNPTTPYAETILAFQAQALENHLKNCSEARKVSQWNTVLKETQSAISLGADSAPQVYALQTEALLKLLRHQEANVTHKKIPKFSLNWCTKLFGPVATAYLLMIDAQVHLASGRFEDAIKAAEQAARVDPSNKEVSTVVKKARAVASARMSGNLLFKASKFTEACGVYNQGLEHDPNNAVLLCNRAACRSKLGQFEKAIEDCNAALTTQPHYRKARLRRADCNAKLERWEAAIQDYEMLIREKPGDEEVARALFEAQLQLKMLRGEDIKDLKFGSNLFFISSNDRFRHYVTSPGMSVVLFCNKATHKQVLLVLEQTCKRFPSVNFLKVEIEDHPYLAKSEGVSSVPAFKIYKNGSRGKEIPGNNGDLLEKSVKLYSS